MPIHSIVPSSNSISKNINTDVLKGFNNLSVYTLTRILRVIVDKRVLSNTIFAVPLGCNVRSPLVMLAFSKV